MGARLVPATMVAAMLAFGVAAATADLTAGGRGWWPAAVALAVLGGITPMIYAVNIRVVPVFARRSWPSPGWLRAQVVLAVAGAWAVYAGRLLEVDRATVLGSALALGGGLAFTANVVRLFRRPAGPMPPPPPPFPEQTTVDAIATSFTRLSGGYLLLGLGIGLVTSAWRPTVGRWDLVWAHTMLVGFFLSMAAGVSYHVLSRWTGRRWRSVAAIRLHFGIAAGGLPLMLLALATDRTVLFAVAGPLQAAAIALFLVNIAPLVVGLPGPTRPALVGAVVLLLGGTGMGAVFAISPELGARMRFVHAELNLFGWTGLLVCGMSYYLVPRFAGQPLRWPRLAAIQLGALGTGILIGAAAFLWRAYGAPPAALAGVGQGVVGAAFLVAGAVLAGTFRGAPQVGTVAPLPRGIRHGTSRQAGA